MNSKKVILVFFLIAAVGNVNSVTNRTFPDYFKFGVATASYQVEGAWDEDGKSENIWDHITHTDPDYILGSYNGDVACDSYHKYKEDVANLKALGVDFYRYSLSWSRIIPLGLAGTPVNPLGIEYYRNLTQELLDNGIEPLVTIYHWDLPEVLQDIGGWPSAELQEHFVYYARTVFEQLGDLVKLWLTFNEPKQVCLQSYGTGEKAPAIKASGIADYKCTHVVLKAHAESYRVYEAEFKQRQGGRIGMVIDSDWFEPISNTEENLEASERALQFTYGWYANPFVNGNYPQVMIDRIAERSRQQGYPESRLPVFTEEEIDYIKGTYDFLALNHYSSSYTQWEEDMDIRNVSYSSDLSVKTWRDATWEPSASTWLYVVPWGIRKLVNWLSKTYGNPEIFITESGFTDRGGLNDDRRINYYREYLSNLLDAVLIDGVNVTHYTAWSLMDNFEWLAGYTEKFGLYSVDFTDPERPRTPKDSAAYYSRIISTRCLIDSCG